MTVVAETKVKTQEIVEGVIAYTFAGAFVVGLLLLAFGIALQVLELAVAAKVCFAVAAFCGVMLAGAFVAGLAVFNGETKKPASSIRSGAKP